LANLPPKTVFKRLINDVEHEVFSICIASRGWIVNRNSGWKDCPCYFSKAQGVLFVYYKLDQGMIFDYFLILMLFFIGYALKLSQAKKLKTTMFKNETSIRATVVRSFSYIGVF